MNDKQRTHLSAWASGAVSRKVPKKSWKSIYRFMRMHHRDVVTWGNVIIVHVEEVSKEVNHE